MKARVQLDPAGAKPPKVVTHFTLSQLHGLAKLSQKKARIAKIEIIQLFVPLGISHV